MPDKKPEIIDTSATPLPGKNLFDRAKLPKGQHVDDGSDQDELFENPRRIIRQGMILIFIFFGIFGVWSFFGHISGAVVASGKIKIENERKVVQHLEGGIVDSILVHEGEEVREGQPLIVLSSVSVDANTNILRKDALALEAKQARLRAEKANAKSIEWPAATRELATEINSMDSLENEEKIFTARRQTLHTQIKLLQSQMAQLNEQIASFETQMKAEKRIIATLNEELTSKRRLLKEHYLDKSAILELERNLAAHEGNRGRFQQNIAEARQRAGELNLRMLDTVGRFQEDVINELGQVDKELIQAREKVRPTADAKRRLQITAPVAGKVVDLQIHSPGGVIRAGETLMDIVPDNQPMIVETQIPVNDITEIYVGQKARVQLDAFDTRFQPQIPGRVTYVSADRIEEGSRGNPYYLCFVEIDQEALAKSDMYISPGMPATVFIMTTEKTVIYYVLEPLLKSWDRALRD